jgi:serine/threonine protein kinase
MQVLAPVAGALAATHAVGGVHRDVKGDNLLVRPEDVWPTLLDFGAGDFLGAPTLTRELLPPGTPYYRSPEALRFHWLHRQLPGAHYEPGPADDVYALGVTAYCLVTGSYPPPVLPPELLASDRSFQPPVWEPPEKLVTVCPQLAALIHQMLSLEPSARGSAAEVEQALARAAHTAGAQADQLIRALAQPSGHGGTAPHADAAEPVARSAIAPAAHSMIQHHSEVTAAQRSRTGLPGAVCALGAGLAVVALISIICAREQGASTLQPEESPERSIAQRQQGSSDEDTAPSGLGREALTVRVDTEEPKPSREEISLEMEKEPLPGQARPPCKRREVESSSGKGVVTPLSSRRLPQPLRNRGSPVPWPRPSVLTAMPPFL